MPRDDKTRFRITTWPGEPLPHPPPWKRVNYRLTDAGMIVADWDQNPELLPASPRWSEEMYLELVAVDLDDPDAIMDFVQVFGELGMRTGRAVNERIGLAGLTYLYATERYAKDLLKGHRKAAKESGLGVGAGETLDEFRWGALCMRDLVSAWRVVNGELDPAGHRWEAPVWPLANYPEDDVPWREESGPTVVLKAGLGSALECFAPVIKMDWELNFPTFDDVWAYEVCCLELFNHIVENAPYKQCANKSCGRLFVRQRGRSAHGQYRTKGVKYCSAEWARAQAQRDYRRRKAS